MWGFLKKTKTTMSQWPVSNPVCHQFYSVDVITRPMKGCVRTNWRVWFHSSIFRGWRGDVRVEGLHVHLIMTGTCMPDMRLLFVYNPFSVTYSSPETKNGNMQEAKCGTKHIFLMWEQLFCEILQGLDTTSVVAPVILLMTVWQQGVGVHPLQ